MTNPKTKVATMTHCKSKLFRTTLQPEISPVMPRTRFLILVGFTMLSMFAAATVFANASVPQTVQYQGRLTDSAGNPITAATANLTFHVYNTQNVGSGSEMCPPFTANNVALVSGLFNVTLSFQWLGDPITNALKAGTTLWLQTDYNNTPIGTRQQISAALAAFRAQQADTAAYAKGFALAPASADSSVLQTNSVTSLKILDGSVNNSDLANGAVTGSKIAVATLTAAQMVPASLDSSVLQANSVTSLKILDGSVNTSDLASGAVTTNKIAPNAVDSTLIAVGSVPTNRLIAAPKLLAAVAGPVQYNLTTSNSVLTIMQVGSINSPGDGIMVVDATGTCNNQGGNTNCWFGIYDAANGDPYPGGVPDQWTVHAAASTNVGYPYVFPTHVRKVFPVTRSAVKTFYLIAHTNGALVHNGTFDQAAMTVEFFPN